MNEIKRNFEDAAAAWDEKPGRVKLADDVSAAIAEVIDFHKTMDIMDFGCGTGLISLRFQPLVRSITGVDSSRAMLNVFNQKAVQAGWSNVTSVLVDLAEGDQLAGEYDIILSSMTMHHIPDLGPLLRQFHRILKPFGVLCIADLDLDGGKFHSDNTGVFHFGFDRGELRRMAQEAGFEDLCFSTATESVKAGEDGETRRFAVFLMVGRKHVIHTRQRCCHA